MSPGPVFVALVNPKSGGNVGSTLLARFKEILDSSRVYNLAEEGPKRALEEHWGKPNLRIIACGGDGTVGWILSVMDALDLPRPRPAIGIIPLGTGNDLARSLNWGGKYRDKPLRKVLLDVAKAEVVELDRWSLKVTRLPYSEPESSIKEGSERPVDALPLKVLNNYFSVGIDADIALQFHRARNSNPGNFTSRTRNLIFYGVEGGKDLFKHKWRNLMSHVTVECDGVDFTKRLADYGAHSVLVLNIPSYSGGTKPWNSKTKGKQEMNDGLLELIAIDNLDLAILHAGGSGLCVTRCKSVTLTARTPVPMQIDGEPCFMQPCRIEISHKSQGKMLARNKKATYDVRDDEIDNWAAKKIQTSFKKYQHQKSLSQDRPETPENRAARVARANATSETSAAAAASAVT